MAITLAQSQNGQINNTGASVSVTLPGATTSGNLLAVVATSYQGGGNPNLTCTDNKGNTFTLTQASNKTNLSGYLYVWYCANIVGGATHTITVTADATAYVSVAVMEFSGVATTSVLDKISAATSGAGSNTAGSTGTVTTTTDGELYLGAATEDSAVSFTAGNGFTKLFDVTTGQNLHVEYKVGAAQSTSGLFTWASSTTWAGQIATFKAAVSGPQSLSSSDSGVGVSAQSVKKPGGTYLPVTPEVMMTGSHGDFQSTTITIAGMPHPILVGHRAILINASTVDSGATLPGNPGWGGIDSFSDNKGNTWQRVAHSPLDSTDVSTTVEYWTAFITAELDNGDIFSITGDARGLSMVYALLDVDGLLESGDTVPIDVIRTGVATSWNAPFTDTPSVDNTAQENELVIDAIGVSPGTEPLTPGAGYTELVDEGIQSTINRGLYVQFKNISTIQTPDGPATITSGNAVRFANVLTTWKIAPSKQTHYVSKGAEGSDSNDGASKSNPFSTIAHAISMMNPGDICLMRGGDTFNEGIFPGDALSGTASVPTIFGAYPGPNGERMAIIRTPDTSACLGFYPGPASYFEFDDLDMSNQGFADADNSGNAITGEHIVETPSGGAGGAGHVTFRRCYLHHSGNCIVYSYNGPTPRSSSGNGTGIGNDSDWLFEDCELYAAGNSIAVMHGSRPRFIRCHIHRWGESSDSLQKHGVYDLSEDAIFDGCTIHNDEAKVGTNSGPSEGNAISQRATGAIVRNCIIHDCNPFEVFWYDNIKGTSIIHNNRIWVAYDGLFFFDASNDTGYTWGPNPVDEFVFANNTVVVAAGHDRFIDFSTAAGAYLGGLDIGNNVFILDSQGAASIFGITGQHLLTNNGILGTILEKNNFYAVDSAGAFKFVLGSDTYTMAQWKTATTDGNLQGQGSILGALADVGLGAAPAFSVMRAPTPFMILGVDQVAGDNDQIPNMHGAPDFYPQDGSPVRNAGTTNIDTSLSYIQDAGDEYGIGDYGVGTYS